MSTVGLAPFVFLLHGLLMAVDEFHFHRQRGLPRWERIGHPLDTLTVLVPLFVTLMLPHHAPWTAVFLVLAVFSCLFVTKDEWVHARFCPPGEQWLHAVLFLLHPVLFATAFFLWKEDARGWLLLQTSLASGFLCWQTGYWMIRGDA